MEEQEKQLLNLLQKAGDDGDQAARTELLRKYPANALVSGLCRGSRQAFQRLL